MFCLRQVDKYPRTRQENFAPFMFRKQPDIFLDFGYPNSGLIIFGYLAAVLRAYVFLRLSFVIDASC